MARSPALFLTVLFLISGSSITAENLELGQIIDLIIENDANVQIAGKYLNTAENAWKLAKASIRPQVKASQAPAYTYSHNSTIDPESPDPLNPLITNLDIHGVSASVGVTQPLPTDGILTANLSDTVTITKTGDDTTEIAQSPSISISLSQPLFFNGKIIDMDVFQARMDTQGRIPIALAASQELSARNGAIIGAATAYAAIVELRARLDYLNRNIDISLRRLALTKIRSEQGSLTIRNVWEAELAIESLREQQLELKYTLLETEQSLERAAGEQTQISGTPLSTDLPVVSGSLDPQGVLNYALSASIEVLQNSLSLEEKNKNAIISGRQYASDLTIGLSFAPKYEPGITGWETFGESVESFFEDDAYLSTSLSIGLSVPVYQGGQKKYQRNIESNTAYIAEATLNSTRQRIADKIGNLFLRRDLLMEKLDLAKDSMSLERERLADSKRLYDLKSLTALDLDLSQLSSDEKELAIWRTQADLFLNAMEILSTAGHDIQTILEGQE